MTPADRLLGSRNLIGLVTSFAMEESLNTFFQDQVFRSARRIEPMDSDNVDWDEVQFPRHLAPFGGRGQPYHQVAEDDIIHRSNAMAHIRLSKRIPADKLFRQRAPGELRPNARAVVAQAVQSLTKLIRNSIEYLCVNTLNGSVTVNSSNIPGSQVAFTVTYSTNTYAASSSWASMGTPIVSSELPAMKQDYMQTAGMMPGWAISGGTVQGYIAQNTEVTSLLQQQMGVEVARSAANLAGEMLEGLRLGDLRWTVNEAGYVPEGGSFTRWMPATDDLFLLPEGDLGDVLGMAEGRGFLPATQGIATPQQAENLIVPAPSPGLYAFAARSSIVPDAIEVYVGWVGLPLILFPSGILVADLVP